MIIFRCSLELKYLARCYFFLCIVIDLKMIESLERHSSDTNVKQLKEELNIERHEWPSKRELYTICGKLGEGATGNVSRIDRVEQ